MSRLLYFALLASALCFAGCSGSGAPVEGDSPASSAARAATKDEVSRRSGINQTTNPPGTGRAGAGGDASQLSGGQ